MKAKDIHYPSLIREMQEFGAKRSLEFESQKEAKKAFENFKDALDSKTKWKTPSPQAYDGSTVSRLEIEDSLLTLDKINKIWHEMLKYDKPKKETPYNPRFKNGINYRKIKI